MILPYFMVSSHSKYKYIHRAKNILIKKQKSHAILIIRIILLIQQITDSNLKITN